MSKNIPANEAQFRMIKDDVILGEGTKVFSFTNLYGCEIGSNCMIGAFVEIQAGATVGNGSRISSHSFICDNITIGENVFVAHGVMFVNHNRTNIKDVRREGESVEVWKERIGLQKTYVADDVIIGSNATIMGGITIGKGATIGAGAVVTKNVPAGETWVGNPARKLEKKDVAN